MDINNRKVENYMNRIKHIENKGFFIFDEDEKETLAELTYKKNGDILIIDHTYVSDKLRNQGIAGKLLNVAVNYARENKYKIKPVCSYVVKKFESSEFDDVNIDKLKG